MAKTKIFEAQSSSKPISPSLRQSVEQLRQTIKPAGRNSLLASFLTFPRQICFETQEKGESVVLFLRQHLVVNLGWLFFALFLSILPPFFIFFPPYSSLPTNFRLVITMTWYLVLSGFVLAKFMSWFYNIFILTDERIIDVDFLNLFSRVISDAKIDHIQDINSEMSGVWQTFFNFGTVFIQTAGEKPQFTFQNIPQPDKVVEIINHLVDLEEQEKLEGRVK